MSIDQTHFYQNQNMCIQQFLKNAFVSRKSVVNLVYFLMYGVICFIEAQRKKSKMQIYQKKITMAAIVFSYVIDIILLNISQFNRDLMIREIQTVNCPFNKYHKISKDKILTHIRKCKEKQFSNLVMCKYSELHWFNINQIKAHQKLCNQSFSSLDTYQIAQQLKSSQKLKSGTNKKQKQDVSFEPFLDQISMINATEVKKEKPQKAVNNFKKSKKQQKPQLWKQPDFAEWLDQEMSKKKKPPNNQVSMMINQSNFDLEFNF